MEGKNYIYEAGRHADHMRKWFDIHGIPYEGFVYVSGNKRVPEDKRIITLEEFKTLDDAYLLITQDQWQEVYDSLWSEVDQKRIYVNTTWYRGGFKCMMCDNDLTFSTDAEFAPFLEERIWKGDKKITQIVHCPRCRCYYSLYRPTDVEMDLLYSGYRGEKYLSQRSSYEPEYTEELNRELNSPADGGRARKRKIWDLILCNQVLEHLSNPRYYFKELVSYMSEKILLYIEVPMERWVENKEFVFIHEHINYLRETVFKFWAEENNLKILKARTGVDIQVLFSR